MANFFSRDTQGVSSSSTVPLARAAVPERCAPAVVRQCSRRHAGGRSPRFPCIGKKCSLLATPWKAAGTLCQPFFDGASRLEEKRRWQHMCMPCVADSIAKQEESTRRFCNGGTPDKPLAAALVVSLDQTEDAVAATRQQQAPAPAPVLAASSPRPGEEARFISHHDERVQLGRPIWQEVAERIPHVRTDGSLAMPQGSQAPDLKALKAAFPRLPRILPDAASLRAAARSRAALGAFGRRSCGRRRGLTLSARPRGSRSSS